MLENMKDYTDIVRGLSVQITQSLHAQRHSAQICFLKELRHWW